MDKLRSRFHWCHRDKITLFIGSLFLLLGAIFPWYSLPKESLEAFETNLFWANAARFPVILFAICSLIFTFWLRSNPPIRLAFWYGLIAVLLFPYLLITLSPTVNFLAQAYNAQAEQVSYHVDKNSSQVQAQWKQYISLDKPTSIKSTFDFSIKDSLFFQMSSWDLFLTKGLGYNNSILQFIGRGWSLSVIGFITSLFGFYLLAETENISSLIKDVSKFMPVTGLILATIFFLLISINIFNHQLDTMFAKGNYTQVIAISQNLAYWYPPLRGDETFIERLALAKFYNNESESSLTNFAQGLQSYLQEDFQQAENYFRKSLFMQKYNFLFKAYLANAIINQGVNYFNDPNSKKPGGAANYFEEALLIFPGHIEALYDLMLARTVNGEFEKSSSVAQKIVMSQKYFQQAKLSLLGQTYIHLTWEKYQKNDMKQAWQRYRQSVDQQAWKESKDDNE